MLMASVTDEGRASSSLELGVEAWGLEKRRRDVRVKCREGKVWGWWLYLGRVTRALLSAACSWAAEVGRSHVGISPAVEPKEGGEGMGSPRESDQRVTRGDTGLEGGAGRKGGFRAPRSWTAG